MIVLIVAVCVNIALVTSQDIDINSILKILKERKYTETDTAETNEPVEAIPIIPGFYMQKPKELTKSLFKYPKGKHNAVYSSSKNKNSRPKKTKALISNTDSKNDYLTDKILKAIKNLDQYKNIKKYVKIEEPSSNYGSMSIEGVLGKMLKGIKTEKGYRETKKYPKKELHSLKDGYKTPNNLVANQLLTQMLNGFKNKNVFKEVKKFDKIHEHAPNNGFISPEKSHIEQLLTKIINGVKNSSAYQEDEKYDKTEEFDSAVTNIVTEKPQKVLVEKVLKKILSNLKNENNGYRGSENYRYQKTEEPSWNTDSAKDFLANIIKTVKRKNQHQENNKRPRSSIMIVKTNPSSLLTSPPTADIEDFLNGRQHSSSLRGKNELEMTGEETNDDDVDDESEEGLNVGLRTRREGDKVKCEDEDGSSDEGSDEEDNEKNPGNPYTVHKNKYKQNWPWNHYMDGDHMNINPFGPQFGSLGPSGPELFFGRKWWYFNQDDYKPMG